MLIRSWWRDRDTENHVTLGALIGIKTRFQITINHNICYPDDCHGNFHRENKKYFKGQNACT